MGKTNDINVGRLKYRNQLPKTILSFFDYPEQIDELAEKGVVPHYRLVNTLTQKISYLFDSVTFQKFLKERCITEVEGKSLTVISFNDHCLPFKDNSLIPHELKSLNNDVYILPLAFVNSPSGIYFMYMDEELVYIGQSINISSRIINHYRENTKVFNKVFFIKVDADSLLSVERDLIKKFNPKYNKTNGNH